MLDKTQNRAKDLLTNLKEIEELYQNDIKELNEEIKQLELKRAHLQEVKQIIDTTLIADPITLNVGGMKFQTSRATLTNIKDSYFDVMLSGQVNIQSIKDKPSNNFFIDRDGSHFRYILNYMRDGDLKLVPESVIEELKKEMIFYKLMTPPPSSPSSLINTTQFHIIDKWLESTTSSSKFNILNDWKNQSTSSSSSSISSPTTSLSSSSSSLPSSSSHTYNLIYKASRDGFSSLTFHKLCNSKGSTITIIKSTDGSVFGGYNSRSWHSSGRYSHGDDKCFIFTIVNKKGIPPTKYHPDDQYYFSSRNREPKFVFCSEYTGPTFGGPMEEISSYPEYDILIHEDGKTGSQYFPSSYFDTTGYGHSTLTPNPEFMVEDIEVFTVFNHNEISTDNHDNETNNDNNNNNN